MNAELAAQVRADVNELFAMHTRIFAAVEATREDARDRGEYFTEDAQYQRISALMSAVSLAADLGVMVCADLREVVPA